ncbi:MAG: pyridoxal phosphate-dependent aminotransferase [Victivallales bacterium]|nr:pyridoxal phosphate-dependent aminotransferase [Victivallales bacterium]
MSDSHCPLLGNMTPSATLAITSMAKALKAAGEDVCSMSAGEPDFDTFDAIKEACIKALKDGKTSYTPASGVPELKRAIVAKFKRDNGIDTTVEQVVVAPGAKYACFDVIANLCAPGDEVIIPSPYWLSYPEMVRGVGAVPVFVAATAANNYELRPEDLEQAITPKTKLLILNTPSNPTGAVYRRATLEAIAAIAVRRNIMIMADEIYEKLIYDAELPHISIASLSPEIAARTITVNGFSKSYAMTGWRLGYLTAPLWLAKRIIAFQSHTISNPTTFSQYGALAGLEQCDEQVEAMRRVFAQRRDLIVRLLAEVPKLKFIRPSGAFYVFCDISAFPLKSAEFCERLLAEEKLAAIPGAPFGDDHAIRVSYACSEAAIEKSVARLKKFCASL